MTDLVGAAMQSEAAAVIPLVFADYYRIDSYIARVSSSHITYV